MALTVQSVENYFDANIHDERPYIVNAKAQAGQLDAIHQSFAEHPTFRVDVSCTADADDGVILSLGGGGSGSSTVAVPFPPNSVREIRFRTTSRTGGSTAASSGDIYVGEIVQYITGVESGTTDGVSHPVVSPPKLVGGHRYMAGGGTTALYGDVQYVITGELDQATTAPTETINDAGISLGANSFTNGVATLTFPLHYEVRYKGSNVTQSSFGATGVQLLAVDVINDTVTAVGQQGTTAGWEARTPADGDILHMAFEIWPPTFVRALASATTAGTANTPALVTVELDSNLVASATTYAAKHRVDVFVSPPRYNRV